MRHELTFTDTQSGQVELLYKFPVQPGLTHPLSLALQNEDELNLGVEKFWSYFFPYEEVEAEFEHILEEWIAGRARIVRYGKSRARDLELLKDGRWEAVYRANGLLLRRRNPIIVAQNA